jgi:hypothetical protein
MLAVREYGCASRTARHPLATLAARQNAQFELELKLRRKKWQNP